jgi:hypothetical protein
MEISHSQYEACAPSDFGTFDLENAVLREVHALDQNLALYEMSTLQEQVNRCLTATRGRHLGFDLGRVSAAARCSRTLWSDVLLGSAKHT